MLTVVVRSYSINVSYSYKKYAVRYLELSRSFCNVRIV